MSLPIARPPGMEIAYAGMLVLLKLGRARSVTMLSADTALTDPPSWRELNYLLTEVKSDINWVIMDYLVNEGYPKAAEKFAQETSMQPADFESIHQRVEIRNAIHAGDIETAIDLINECNVQVSQLFFSSHTRRYDYTSFMHHSYPPPGVDDRQLTTSVLSMSIYPTISLLEQTILYYSTDRYALQILDTDPILHFELLQLELIELIRTVLSKPGTPSAADFTSAIQFATNQLSPRAPTDRKYLEALERTMALMIFPPDKMAPEFKRLLDINMRQSVARKVNEAILSMQGERREAKIRQLVRARVWAEQRAREAKVELPPNLPIGLDLEDEGHAPHDGEPMVT